jgi:MoxR-like ATPase
METQSETAAGMHPLEHPFRVCSLLRRRLRAAIKGRDEVIDLIITALLADGHVLLEDYPGSGKTTLAKTLGESITDAEGVHIAPFRRVQFTPDLLPSDVSGVSVFDAPTGRFEFRPGPIFAHVLLADEINRTSPKVQSAMLEAMAEKQVTVDNHTYRLDDLFFVIATQNPRDLAGTYPLPVAQLDRFLFKINMDYIDRAAEIDVLATRKARREVSHDALVTRDEVVDARRLMDEHVHVDARIHTCLVDAARNLRAHKKVLQGLSTRSLVLMIPALQATALLRQRDFVSPEDIAYLAPFVFAHRLVIAPGAGDARALVAECLRGPLEELTRSTMANVAQPQPPAAPNGYAAGPPAMPPQPYPQQAPGYNAPSMPPSMPPAVPPPGGYREG